MSRPARISLLIGLMLVVGSALPSAASAGVASAGVGSPKAAATTTSARTAITAPAFESKLLALINARRKKIGCPTLRVSPALTKAARAHNNRMVAAKSLSHQLPKELGLAKRIVKAGYTKWKAAAENIAWGPGSPQGVYAMWMNSKGHRANLQRCTFRDAGFGVVIKRDVSWVTLDLGRRR